MTFADFDQIARTTTVSTKFTTLMYFMDPIAFKEFCTSEGYTDDAFHSMKLMFYRKNVFFHHERITTTTDTDWVNANFGNHRLKPTPAFKTFA